MTTYKNGVVIGKFWPFHNGHAFLIRTALQHAEFVNVIVCHQAAVDIPAELRAKWIIDEFPHEVNNRLFVSVIDADRLGLTDDDSMGWADATIRHLGFCPDVAFTSEPYGAYWAAFMGGVKRRCDHYMVDQQRTMHNVSGTMIREAPLEHLDKMPQHVGEYFLPLRVLILGAESTGKTTLTKTLAKEFKVRPVLEFGRLYTEQMPDPQAHVWTPKDFEVIALQQDAHEDAAIRSQPIVICDTNSYVTGVFEKEYLGQASLGSSWLQSAIDRDYDLVLLTDPTTPMVQDDTGLRMENQATRERMHNEYVSYIRARKFESFQLSGSPEVRFNMAKSTIRRMLAEKQQGVLYLRKHGYLSRRRRDYLGVE